MRMKSTEVDTAAAVARVLHTLAWVGLLLGLIGTVALTVLTAGGVAVQLGVAVGAAVGVLTTFYLLRGVSYLLRLAVAAEVRARDAERPSAQRS